MSEELKPCPFCGDEPHYPKPPGNHIYCTCGALMRTKNEDDFVVGVAEAWNRRILPERLLHAFNEGNKRCER